MRFLASLTMLSVAVLTLAGCPAGTPMCPPDGIGFHNGMGLYCAYGVVVGGFRNCPAEMPNRYDFADGSFVCSSRPIGSRDAIPEDVCASLTACAAQTVDTCTVTLAVGEACSFTTSCEMHVCPDCCSWNRWDCEAGRVTVTTRRVPGCGLNDASTLHLLDASVDAGSGPG